MAKNESYALRASFYEFHYQPIANALAAAVERGVDVKIVYDAESTYREKNEEVLQEAGLIEMGATIPRTVSEGIRHNKTIVLLKDGQPIAGLQVQKTILCTQLGNFVVGALAADV